MTHPISYTEFKRRLDAATEELKRWPIKLDSTTGEPTDHERRKAAAVLEQFGIVDFRLEWVNRGWVMREVAAK